MSRRLPFVSVVIPAFNEAAFLPRTLTSLQEQDYPGQFEIIVVDNASTDQTAAIATSFGASVIRENRKGVQFARQTGFERARGKIIASTDADNILPSYWLQNMITQLQSHPDYLAVGGWFTLAQGPLIPRFMINVMSRPTLIFYKIFLKNILTATNFVVWQSAFAQTDGFQNVGSVNEDLLLAKRLALHGKVKFLYNSQYKVITSSRRWNKGFVHGSLPYFLNATSYIICKRLFVTQLADIRIEKARSFHWRTVFVSTMATLVFAIGFFSIPISPAHAKVMPLTQRAKTELLERARHFPPFEASSSLSHKLLHSQ